MTKRSAILILKIVVTVSLLGLVLTIVPISEILAVLGSASPSLFALAFAIVVLDQYLGAAQLSALTRTLELRFTITEIFRINVITGFYQLLLPGSLSAGLARWYMLSTPDRQYSRAFSCIVFNRLVENITLIVVGTLCWWLGRSPPFGSRIGLLLLLLLLVFSTAYLLMFSRLPVPPVLARLGALSLQWLPAPLGTRLRQMKSQLGRARDFPARSHAYVFSLSIVRQMLGILGFFLLALAILLPIGPLEIGWVRSFVQLVGQLPISIAGLGVREGALLSLLPLYGVGTAAAVAFSFLLLARSVLLAICGGLLEARYRLVWGR